VNCEIDALLWNLERGIHVKSLQDRQRDERERKLADIQRQIEQGTLVVRKMTEEERQANPPRPRPAGGPRQRRRG